MSSQERATPAATTVVITGANSGIGLAAARQLAQRGARVLLACRSMERATEAQRAIAAEQPSACVEAVQLDLASLDSVRQAATEIAERCPRLDVLINNAGVMAVPHARTAEGFELQLGVNHFGHFALTGLLLGPLLAAEAARVVTVTSLMHRVGRMRWHDLDWERGYDKWLAYSQSKLANLLFAAELQRRFSLAGVRALSVACHPGYANTNLQMVGPELEGSGLMRGLFRASNTLFAQSPDGGARPTVYAATAPELRGGECVGPGGPFELAGAPRVVRVARHARDAEAAHRLWQLSAERTGVDYARLAPASGDLVGPHDQHA